MAVQYSLQGLEKSKEIGHFKGQIRALFDLGNTYGMTSDYPQSLDYFNQCLKLAKKDQDFDLIISIYMSFGIVYKRIGDYTTSQDYYLKSLKLVDSIQEYENPSISRIYINLGILYDLMNQEQKAIDSYQKALDMHYGSDYDEIEMNVLANLAEIDLERKDYESALAKFFKRAAFAEKNDRVPLGHVYGNIGFCYINLKQYDLAEKYLFESLRIAEQLSLKQEIAVTNGHLANLKLQQDNLEEAILYSEKNIKALQGMGEYEYKEKAHALAAKIYEKVGSYSKVAYHLEQTMIYQDSLLNEVKVREIQNLQIQHDVYLKDREIKENELQLTLLNTRVSQNKKRLLYLSIIALLLLFSAGLLYFRYLGKKKSNRIFREKNKLISEQKYAIEKMNEELEKSMLRAQMNPHFIFNSLNSIQHFINSGDKVTALTYLTKFSKLLRQVLETSVNISLVLEEEIELLKIYVELESLRFDGSFNYAFHIDENLDVHKYEVPMLLVQPFIENAIIHGLMPKKGDKKLSISFVDQKDHIACIVEDNGVGFDTKAKQAKSRITSRGMSITTKRIEALKRFSNQELLTVENLNNGNKTGTKVIILIPKD
ncbi:tetratricopeptide repeat-containing sensor histidine kinase [Flagellimonas sp. 2504JD4-2]